MSEAPVHRVRVQGWRYGFQKVSNTKTLMDRLGLGLADAKKLTDRMLADEEVWLEVASAEAAEELAAALQALGAEATAVSSE